MRSRLPRVSEAKSVCAVRSGGDPTELAIDRLLDTTRVKHIGIAILHKVENEKIAAGKALLLEPPPQAIAKTLQTDGDMPEYSPFQALPICPSGPPAQS